MTGADVKQQVMEALHDTEDNPRWWKALDAAEVALAPCVVLTLVEAEDVADLLLWVQPDTHGRQGRAKDARALLTEQP